MSLENYQVTEFLLTYTTLRDKGIILTEILLQPGCLANPQLAFNTMLEFALLNNPSLNLIKDSLERNPSLNDSQRLLNALAIGSFNLLDIMQLLDFDVDKAIRITESLIKDGQIEFNSITKKFRLRKI